MPALTNADQREKKGKEQRISLPKRENLSLNLKCLREKKMENKRN